MEVSVTVGRPKAKLVVSATDREQLEKLANSCSLPAGLVKRKRIKLLSADGMEEQQIAKQLEMTNASVNKWCRSFVQFVVTGLHDELRPRRARSA